RRQTRDGDLVLVDAAAEWGQYTADVTRTWPVNGKFTPRQKAVYDLVLATQQVAFDSVRPGTTMRDLNRVAQTYMREHSAKLCGVVLVRVVEHVGNRQGGERAELLARLGILADVDIHLGQLEAVEDVLRLEGDGARQVLLGILPVALVQEAAAEQRLGEELLEPRQTLDLGMPRADQVMRAVMRRVELDRLHPLVVDDLGEPHPLLAAARARQPAQRLADREMAVRASGVHPHRLGSRGERRGIACSPQMLGRVL